MSDRVRILNGEKIHKLYQALKEKLRNIVPIVVLCGPGKCEENTCEECPQNKKDICGYHERIKLTEHLSDENCLPVIPEEEFDLEIASIEETILLGEEEIDKIVIIPTSEGSAAELAIFSRNIRIRPKLLVLVPYQFHPFYSDSESFLTSIYKELIAITSHVFPYDRTGEKHPTAFKILSLFMLSYRLNKLIEDKIS